MVKSLLGFAAAAVLTTVAASSPANAFAVRHAPGVAQDQATVEHAQYWGYRRYGYPYRAYPYAYRYPYRYRYAAPYAYAAPYPYYRRYYGPYAYGAPYPYYRRYGYGGPFVRIGPIGFGVW